MNFNDTSAAGELGPRLNEWPLPGKVLVTMVVVMLAIGMCGALGQIVVHDVIPTFESEATESAMPEMQMPAASDSGRGDLFGNAPAQKTEPPFYETEGLIYALKFTHIHIFGMSAIFILMGAIVLFLDLGVRARTWLIVLPFIGIIIDLASVWLKIYVHPGFFWLHIPGGGLFGMVFVIGAVIILRQLWFGTRVSNASKV